MRNAKGSFSFALGDKDKAGSLAHVLADKDNISGRVEIEVDFIVVESHADMESIHGEQVNQAWENISRTNLAPALKKHLEAKMKSVLVTAENLNEVLANVASIAQEFSAERKPNFLSGKRGASGVVKEARTEIAAFANFDPAKLSATETEKLRALIAALSIQA